LAAATAEPQMGVAHWATPVSPAYFAKNPLQLIAVGNAPVALLPNVTKWAVVEGTDTLFMALLNLTIVP